MKARFRGHGGQFCPPCPPPKGLFYSVSGKVVVKFDNESPPPPSDNVYKPPKMLRASICTRTATRFEPHQLRSRRCR